MQNPNEEPTILKFPEPPKRQAPLAVVSATVAGLLGLAALMNFDRLRAYFTKAQESPPPLSAQEEPGANTHNAAHLKSLLDQKRRDANRERTEPSR